MFLELSLGLEIYFLDSEEVDLWRRTWLFRIVWIIISLPGNLWIRIHSGTSPLQIISTREFELFVLYWKFWRRVIENSNGTKLFKVTFLL